MTVESVNWNNAPDIDREVWDRVTKNFWLDTKVPISNDLPTWRNKLNDAERDATMKVFANLATLDTLQSELGAPTMMNLSETHFEAAIYANFTFMEAVHAKSYSSIFSTLSDTPSINEAFRWAAENEEVQRKADLVKREYLGAEQAKAGFNGEESALFSMGASVLLESFLFYSGFYLPFKFSSNAKLTNTADIIRLILRDEGIHGYYIGQKFQERFAVLEESRKSAVLGYIHSLAFSLYQNELEFTQDIYDPLGWTEGAKRYIRYNANKAMQNLGFENLFSDAETDVEPAILSQMASDANETHDFFSGSGSSYVIGTSEETTDEDWG